MLSVKSLDGAPLYRQVQAGIEEMIRANPRAKLGSDKDSRCDEFLD